METFGQHAKKRSFWYGFAPDSTRKFQVKFFRSLKYSKPVNGAFKLAAFNNPDQAGLYYVLAV